MGANVDGVVYGMRAVLPLLAERGGGSIVATASLAGVIAFSNDPIYALTKHAVVGLVRSAAQSVGRPGRARSTRSAPASSTRRCRATRPRRCCGPPTSR